MSKKKEKLKFSNLKLRQNKSTVTNSLNENDKISSYFPKISQEFNSQVETKIFDDKPKGNDVEQTVSNREFDIPCSILDMSSTDVNCFKSVRVKQKKQLKLLACTKTKVIRHKTNPSGDNSLVLESTELCNDSDVNAEHLQLAIAMSRSLQDEDESSLYLNIQQKGQTLKETLKQFGFKSDAKISRSSKPVPQKKKKKSFLRSALLNRTEEDRKNIIEDKVAQIITNIATYNEHLNRKYPVRSELRDVAKTKPGSFILRDLYHRGAPLFHRCELEQVQREAYYSTLVDYQDAADANVLMRNWHAIPGRERTPPRSTATGLQPYPSPELFSEDDYRLCEPESLMPIMEDANKLNYSLSNDNVSNDIFHFESFNDTVCFDLMQSSTSLNLDLKNRDKIGLILSEESREMFENDSCLNVSKAFQIINNKEKEVQELRVLQMTKPNKEDIIDLTQNFKQSEIESETIGQIKSNNSKIEYLIQKTVLNNPKISYCDFKDISISDNYNINATELEDLTCDAASTRSQTSICDQVIDISDQYINLSNDEVMPPHHIPLQNYSTMADILPFSQFSTDSSLDDEELNYSSLHSESNQKNILSFNIDSDKEYNNVNKLNSDEEVTKVYKSTEKHFSSINQYNEALMRHPRVICLSVNGLDGQTSPKMLNESSEKILEENDSWANDAIELHAEIAQSSLIDPMQTCESPPMSYNCNQYLTPTFTPNDALIIKNVNVTPMANYHEMDTPKRSRELDKYGIKPLKRAKGNKILEYIYNATHPVTDTDKIPSPRLCSNKKEQEDRRLRKHRKKYVSNSQVRRRHSQRPPQSANIGCSEAPFGTFIVGNLLSSQDVKEDLIFERTQLSRISSCRIPLHIAWHNFICSRPDIQENILLYEPLQLEDIYLQFKNLRFKFHIQDLTTFLDKRCITIKTTQHKKG